MVPTEERNHMFWEYTYVKKHTENLQLLHDLHAIPTTREQARELAQSLVEAFDLPPVSIKFTGRKSTRGFYEWNTSIISVAPISNVEIVVHELAHHYTHKKLVGRHGSFHGADFVNCLDKLAEKTSNLITL